MRRPAAPRAPGGSSAPAGRSTRPWCHRDKASSLPRSSDAGQLFPGVWLLFLCLDSGALIRSGDRGTAKGDKPGGLWGVSDRRAAGPGHPHGPPPSPGCRGWQSPLGRCRDGSDHGGRTHRRWAPPSPQTGPSGQAWLGPPILWPGMKAGHQEKAGRRLSQLPRGPRRRRPRRTTAGGPSQRDT